MDKQHQLTTEEKKAVFDQVWDAYATKKTFQIWQPLLAIAAIAIVSLSLLLLPNHPAIEDAKNYASTTEITAVTTVTEELSLAWAVEEEESIYDVDLSHDELNNILAGL